MVKQKKSQDLMFWGIYRLSRLQKIAKIERYIVWKAGPEEQAEGVAIQLFANTSERSKGQSISVTQKAA